MYNLIKYLKTMSIEDELIKQKHAKYFLRFLNCLPSKLASHDSTRVTIAYFAICGLDILDSLDQLSETTRKHIIDWIYSLQIVPNVDGVKCGGFQGSSNLNVVRSTTKTTGAECNNGTEKYKWGHLAMTYTGIAILATLGDDFSRLNRKAIIEGVAAVQRLDGSFSASIEGNEHDMRFVYCASAICFMLNDWGTVNKETMAQYIRKSLRYDYGVSQHYEMESHGGTTFCAIAALHLSDQLNILSDDVIEKIKRWLIFRQVDGFNGRPNKLVDSCYSFWICSTLKLLNAFDLTNFENNQLYLFSTQNTMTGGFSKWANFSPDPFHTYFSLCGLSFMDDRTLQAVMPSLNISKRAYEHLQLIHKIWNCTENAVNVKLDVE